MKIPSVQVTHPVAWAYQSKHGRVLYAADGPLTFRGMPHIDHRTVSDATYSSFLVELRDVWVLAGQVKGSRFFDVLTDDNCLLVDGLNFHPRHHLSRAGFCQLRGQTASFDFSVAFLKGRRISAGILIGGMPNVFHWYLEYLARLSHVPVNLFRETPALINADVSSVQVDSLRAAGVDSVLPVLEMFTATRVDRLMVPSIPELTDAVGYLRRALGSASVVPSSADPQIYISRADALNERLEEPRAVEALYSTAGFRVVQLAGSSFASQRQVFSSALSIAGPHGAGLVNAIFAPPDSVVTEIVNPQNARYSFFADLAGALSLGYARVADPSDTL